MFSKIWQQNTCTLSAKVTMTWLYTSPFRLWFSVGLGKVQICCYRCYETCRTGCQLHWGPFAAWQFETHKTDASVRLVLCKIHICFSFKNCVYQCKGMGSVSKLGLLQDGCCFDLLSFDSRSHMRLLGLTLVTASCDQQRKTINSKQLLT